MRGGISALAAACASISELARRRLGRNRRLGAVAVSIAIHAAFFLAVIAPANGSLLTGGAITDDNGPSAAVPVSLAGMPGEASAKATPEQELQSLLTRLRTDASSVVVEPPKPQTKPITKLDTLFDALDRAHADKSGAPGSGGHSRDDMGGKGVSGVTATNTDKSRKQAKPEVNPGASSSSGRLWGQIEPCWRKLPARSTVPVTLEIALNPQGLIAMPPKIIRPSGDAPTETRLISEARALEAVRACVPYHGANMASNGGVVRVEFATTKAGSRQ
jgi:hypothetical protein